MAMPMNNQLPAYQGGQNRFMPQGLGPIQSQGYGFSTNQGPGQRGFNPVSNLSAPGDEDWWDSISQFLFGSPESYNQFQRYGPQGQDALSRLISGGQQNIENPYQGFEPIEQNALRNFYGNTVPGITESFTAFGNNNNRGSSGLTGRLGAAGSGLQAMLAAQKAKYGQEQQQFGLQQQQLGLTPQFDIQRREMQPGILQDITRNFFGVGQNQKGQKSGQNSGIEAIMKALPFLGGV